MTYTSYTVLHNSYPFECCYKFQNRCFAISAMWKKYRSHKYIFSTLW